MGVVKPTGASHEAEISQYLCGFSISVYSFYHPSAQKKQQQQNFCHSSNCNSIFFSFCISSSLWGWGQERRRMCVLKSTHNQCTCRYLVSYIYKLSSEATSAGEEKNNLNMKPEVRSVLLTHLTHPFTAVLAKETQEACDL